MIAEAELRLPKGWLHLQRPLSRKVKFMNRTAILTLGLSLVPLLCRAAEPKAEQGKAIGESTRKLHSEESSNEAQRVCAEDRAALGKGNTTSAITLFSRAISLEPKNADAYLGRAEAYGANGDRDQEISDYGRAIRLDPKNARLYGMRGFAFIRPSGPLILDADVQAGTMVSTLAWGFQQQQLPRIRLTPHVPHGRPSLTIQTSLHGSNFYPTQVK